MQKVKQNIQNTATFDEFRASFIQTMPRYSVKLPGKAWRTRQFALHDSEVKKHLDGDLFVASLGRWYPEYAALDFDSVPLKTVENVRNDLALNDDNSMLLSSESKDSYHLYLRPEYNNKPPTINLLQSVFAPYAKSKGIEIYPQRNRAFRLPFGKGQDCLDFKDRYIQGWEKQLYWLQKKDDFDLSTVSGHQLFLDFKPIDLNQEAALSRSIDVPELLRSGLPGQSTRDEVQFELVKYLWHQNLLKVDCERFIWQWLQKNHNGYSKDLLTHPREVQKHIQHQATSYYNFMQTGAIYPDQPHKNHEGYVCKPDLLEIVKLAKGSLPRMRFIFELVKYMNPRRHRDSVPLHRDKFVSWSGAGTYQRHLNYLESKGILKRGSGYRVGQQSKGIKLTWPYKSDKETVLFNGRAVNTLEKAVPMLFTPEDLRALLRGYVSRGTAQKTTQYLFNDGYKSIHIYT